MKKIMALLLTIVLACCLVSCGTQKESWTGIDVDIANGTFKVSAQEFIDSWNDAVKNFQQTSEDEKAQYIFLFPDFEENEKKVKMSDSIDISYAQSENGMLQEIELSWYKPSLDNVSALNLGFLAEMPTFFYPETSVNLQDLMNTTNKFDYVFDSDANIAYEVIQVSGAYILTISPLNMSE